MFDDAPVVVAANRDERLDRPAYPPHLLSDSPRVIGPQDEKAGGTWIGYNEHRLLIGILNRWTDAELTGERSRGLLVMDALESQTATVAGQVVEDVVEAHEYEGFNLIVADEDDAILYEWDGRLRRTGFDPGVHVVVNVGADDHFEIPRFPRATENIRTARQTAAKNKPRTPAEHKPICVPPLMRATRSGSTGRQQRFAIMTTASAFTMASSARDRLRSLHSATTERSTIASPTALLVRPM